MKSHILIIGALITVVSGIITLNIFFQQSLQTDIAERFNGQQFLLSRSIADDIKSFVRHEQEELLLIAHLLSETGRSGDGDFGKIEEKLRTVHKETVASKLGLIDTRGKIIFFQG